jgi:hypothetical protein
MKPRTALGGLVLCVASGAALLWMAVRPCEPVAQASVERKVAPAPVETPVLELGVITIKAPIPKGSRKGLAGGSAKGVMACTETSPAWHCWQYDDHTQECDCSRETVLR